MIHSTNCKATFQRLLLGVLLSGASVFVRAQAPKPEVVLPPTVEGDWVRTDDVGVGSYGGFEAHFPKPAFTPEGQKIADSFPKFSDFKDISKKVGNTYVVRPHPCAYFGGGFGGIEYNSAGFHIVKTKNEIVIVNEEGANGNARHIFLNRHTLPTSDTHTPSPSGYSIGHIEADGTLVVETSDMTRGIVMSGGGVRTPDTVVTQRFEPSADGSKMKITYTWTDPKIYTKPFTYQFTFERMAPNSVALEDFCDATDPLESQSVVPPTQ